MSDHLMNPPRREHAVSHRQQAFTLIELLVAIGITVLLAGLMLTMMSNVLTGWNRASGKLTAGNQARIVLDQLSQDLQAAIMRHDANTWLVATVQQDQTTTKGDSGLDGVLQGAWKAGSGGLVKPISANGSFEVSSTSRRLDDCRFGQAGVWLRLFTTPPDNAASGSNSPKIENVSAPRAIAYQMVRVKVGGTSSSQYCYALFRSEVRPASGTGNDSTFAVGYNLLMPESTDPGYNKGSGVAGDAGNVRRPSSAQVIANDVIDFGIKLYGRDSAGNEVELFPVPRDANGNPKVSVAAGSIPYTYAATGASTLTSVSVTGVGTIGYPANYASSVYGDTGMNAYPVAAEVMIRILGSEGVRLIAALEAGELKPPAGTNADEYWWQLAEQHSQVFTRRVEIKAAAL